MEIDVFPLPRGPLSDGVGKVGGWNITSYFGPRIDPIRGGAGNHGGQDIAGAGINLQPLYAVVPGYVSQGWDSGGGGNWTTLYAPNGARFGYGHAHHFEPGVNGKNVAAGTLLAWVGTTGASTGSHLHFAYDSEDGNTSYDDPFDILQRAADANRYVGSTPNLPGPTTPEGLTMAQFDEVMAAIARLEEKVGTNLSMEADWENDTRKIVVDGVEQIVRRQGGQLSEAGWSSRPYAFYWKGGDGSAWVLVPSEDSPSKLARYHVGNITEFSGLSQHMLNPHLVALDPTMKHDGEKTLKEIYDTKFPILPDV